MHSLPRASGWLFLSSLIAAACTPGRPPAFVATVAKAERIEVRPGVARNEPVPAGAVRLHGEAFHDRFLELSDEDRTALARVLADDSSYAAHAEGKNCGGFHADYVVQWKSAGKPYQVLLSFACHEALSLGNGSERRNDLTGSGYERLAPILHRASRP